MTSRCLRSLLALAGITGASACAAIAGIELPPAKPADPNAPATLTVPETVVLPALRCGATAPYRGAFSIQNTGQGELSYDVTLRQPNATFGLVDAAGIVPGGTLLPGESRSIGIEARAVLPGKHSAVAVVRSGVSTFLVPIEVDVRGAVLTAIPSSLDLGELRQNTKGDEVPITFRSDGNENLSVTGFGNNPSFRFTVPTVGVPAGQMGSVGVYMTPSGASAEPSVLDLPLVTDGPLCGAAPKLSLLGKRVAADVTVSPLSADFGGGACGNGVLGQATFKVRNDSSTEAATYAASLGPSSRFTIAEPASGTVPIANGGVAQTASIVVSAKPEAFPPGIVEEDLTIAVTVAGVTTPRTAKLRIASYGAVVAATPIDSVPLAVNRTALFSIKNEGNARTCVEYAVDTSKGFRLARPRSVLGPNDDNVFAVTFAGPAPTTDAPVQADVTVKRVECEGSTGLLLNAPFCNEPAAVSVSATR